MFSYGSACTPVLSVCSINSQIINVIIKEIRNHFETCRLLLQSLSVLLLCKLLFNSLDFPQILFPHWYDLIFFFLQRLMLWNHWNKIILKITLTATSSKGIFYSSWWNFRIQKILINLKENLFFFKDLIWKWKLHHHSRYHLVEFILKFNY